MVIEGIAGNVGELPKGNKMVAICDVCKMFEATHGNKCEACYSYIKYVIAPSIIKQFSKCKCEIPEPRSKCSENGISAYCEKCAKEIKQNK